MSGRIRILGILALAVMLVLPGCVFGATIKVGNGNFNDYNELDVALQRANPGDTIQLDNNNGTINSTFKSGNITVFDKNLFLNLTSFSPGASDWFNATIRTNNTIQFSGENRVNLTQKLTEIIFWHDKDATNHYVNNTLVQFTGSTDFLNSTYTTLFRTTFVINASTFTGTALNVSSDNNEIQLQDSSSSHGGHIIGDSSIAVNVSGNSNEIYLATGTGEINSTGIGVNLIGKNNYIRLAADNINAPKGRLYIHPGATGNTLRDYISTSPSFSIYNGSAYNSTLKAGFFYNSTWSKSHGNMNVTISVRDLFWAGNVSVKALYSNVTGTASDFTANSTLNFNSTGVIKNGLIFNKTEKIIFKNSVCQVPVKYTLGGNTFVLVTGTYKNEYPIGTVKIVNFNPFHSITTMNMNETRTTNWTEISDFTSVNPLSFVADNGSVDYRLLGNLTLTQSVNLIGAIDQLDSLATKMTITDRNITLDATSLSSFDKNATLTMYPTFTFSSASNLTLAVTPDGGAKKTLWNGTVWDSVWNTYLSSKIIDMNTSGAAKIYTNHFSKFALAPYTAPTPTPTPAPTAAPSGGTSSSSSGGGTNDISVGVADKLTAGETAGFKIERSAVYEVTATAKNDIQKMMLTVEKRALPKGIEESDKDVYEYDQVVLYWTDDSEISRGTLEFKVSKDWLLKNGLTFGDIVMLRYNEETKTWEELPTEYIGEEENSYLYRATTPGFSYFAIAASEGATMVSEEKSIKTVDIVAEEKTEIIAEPEETAAPAPQETTPAAPLGFAPIFALLISGILLFIRRR